MRLLHLQMENLQTKQERTMLMDANKTTYAGMLVKNGGSKWKERNGIPIGMRKGLEQKTHKNRCLNTL